jgi:hypothetical protein
MRIRILIVVSGALVSPFAATAEPSLPNEAEVIKSCRVMAALGEQIKRCKQRGITPTANQPKSPADALAQLPPSATVPQAAVSPPVEPSLRPFWLLRQDQYDQLSYVIPTRGYQVLQGASGRAYGTHPGQSLGGSAAEAKVALDVDFGAGVQTFIIGHTPAQVRSVPQFVPPNANQTKLLS